jgi:membrane protease YdiL (CAAX protease family)
MLFLPAEEMGWRGFLLPRIQQSRTALTASVVVGIAWAVWHLPAFWFSGIFETTLQVLLAFAVFLPLTVAISVLFTWLYNATRGSVLIATAHHAAYAIGLGMTNIASERLALFFAAYAATMILIACAVVWIYGAANLSRGQRRK